MFSKLFILLRIALGSIFIISGFEKLAGPYQNFLFVIQSYDLLPPVFEELTARIFPWFELFIGLFLFLGLWLTKALLGSLLMSLTFMSVVSQAIIRKLPLDECGCFGELVSFPLHVVLMIDISMCLCALLMLKFLKASQQCSLDAYFSKDEI